MFEYEKIMGEIKFAAYTYKNISTDKKPFQENVLVNKINDLIKNDKQAFLSIYMIIEYVFNNELSSIFKEYFNNAHIKCKKYLKNNYKLILDLKTQHPLEIKLSGDAKSKSIVKIITTFFIFLNNCLKVLAMLFCIYTKIK